MGSNGNGAGDDFRQGFRQHLPAELSDAASAGGDLISGYVREPWNAVHATLWMPTGRYGAYLFKRCAVAARSDRIADALPSSCMVPRNMTGTDIRRDFPYDFFLRESSLPTSASAGKTIKGTKVIHQSVSGNLQYRSSSERILAHKFTGNHRKHAMITQHFANLF